MSKNELSEQVRKRFSEVARTLYCPYCMQHRARENIVQFTPKVKCRVCSEKARVLKSKR